MKDYLPQFIPHPPSKCIKRQESAELAELMRQFERQGGQVERLGKTQAVIKEDESRNQLLKVVKSNAEKAHKKFMAKKLPYPEPILEGYYTCAQIAWIMCMDVSSLRRRICTGSFPGNDKKLGRAELWEAGKIAAWFDNHGINYRRAIKGDGGNDV